MKNYRIWKKRTSVKVLGVLLAGCMFVSAMPVTVGAAETGTIGISEMTFASEVAEEYIQDNNGATADGGDREMVGYYAQSLIAATGDGGDSGEVETPDDESHKIAIDEVNFPDSVFRKFISEEYDTSKDGYLSPNEIAIAKDMFVNTSTRVVDLTGIEYFTALEKLTCFMQGLRNLDVSQNTALKYLNCEDNQLRTLDVSKNAALETLICTRNMLSSLDVSQNTALETLECNINYLEGLDVSHNLKLVNLNCDCNSLPSLDVSKNTVLEQLKCSCVGLEDLDVSQNIALTTLVCTQNDLSSLDVRNNKELQQLDCSYNLLKVLDVSRNTALQSLKCTNNRLSSLDISKNSGLETFEAKNCAFPIHVNTDRSFDLAALPSDFDVTKSSEWEGCTLSGSIITINENWDYDSIGYDYDCGNGQTIKFYLFMLDETVTGVPIDAEHFPDARFRWQIKLYYDNGDGILTEEETDIEKMSLNYRNISDLKGIEYFTNLSLLSCLSNHLRNLDVSKNTKLIDLECGDNLLTGLDVSKNTALEHLGCAVNQLTNLDIGRNTALIELECYDNQLTSLDLSNNKNLESIHFGYNQLSSLDVSNNKELKSITCFANQLTSLDVSNNKELIVIYCSNNLLTGLDISNNKKLESLYCSNNQLTSLDVSKHTSLETLECENNLLTGLDLSKNKSLSELDCSNNRLTSLDISNNSKIDSWFFKCYGNRYPISISADGTFDLSTLPGSFNVKKTSNWTGGTVSGNTLTLNPNVTEVSYTYDCGNSKTAEFVLVTDSMVQGGIAINAVRFPDEAFRQYIRNYVDTSKDGVLSDEEISAVKSMDVSGKGIAKLTGIEIFTELSELNCSNNVLTQLDVGSNLALTTLDCSGNQLSSLDISGNNMLAQLHCENNAFAIRMGTDRKFDLTKLPGNFDVRKADSWTGGTVNGSILIADMGAVEVGYTYDCGNNQKVNFTLTITIVEKGLKVVLENPEEVYTYSGSAIKPAIIVMQDGNCLTEGTDYTVKYSYNTNASINAAENKKPRITIVGKGNLTGSAYTNFEIMPKNINDEDIVVGSVIIAENTKAAPVLVFGGYKLVSKDYTIGDADKKYTENGTMTVTGKGNFVGERKINVKVVPKEALKKFTVTVGNENLVYNGKNQYPSSIMVADSKTKEPVNANNYEIVYGKDTINAGKVKLTVIGIGEYTGTVTKTYAIKPLKAPAGSMAVKGVKGNYAFRASGAVFGDEVTVTYDSTILKLGKDYKITYSNNKKASNDKTKAKYTVTFLGNYKGTAKLSGTFNVTPAVLDSSAEVVVGDKVYTGKPGTYKSIPYVTVNGTTLKSSDFVATYYKDAGMKQEIKGKNNNITLDGGSNKVSVYVKIVGKGNYAPADSDTYVTAVYEVCNPDIYADLSKAKVTIVDKNGNKISKVEYTGDAQEPEIKVEIKDGKTYVPVASGNYKVSYVNNTNKGKATVVVNGIGKYAGSKTATFNIVAWNIKNVIDLFKSTLHSA